MNLPDSNTTPLPAPTPFHRLRRRLQNSLRYAEDGPPDLDTVDTICCALSAALLDLDEIEVLTGQTSPDAKDAVSAKNTGTKIYRGWRVLDGSYRRACVSVNGVRLDPAPSQKVWNHSDGFEWGYSGSGPAQLSLAILLVHFEGDAERAIGLHQSFKCKAIGRLPRFGEWSFGSHYIDRVVEEIERERGQYPELVLQLNPEAVSTEQEREEASYVSQ